MDHVPSERSEGTHQGCGQVMCEGERDSRRSRHEVASSGTKKLEKWRWIEFETTANWNAGSNHETSRFQWAQVNLRDVLWLHRNKPTWKS